MNSHQLSWGQFLFYFLLFFMAGIIGGGILGFIAGIFMEMSDTDLNFLFEGHNYILIDAVSFFLVLVFFPKIRQFLAQALDFSVMKIPRTYGYIAICLLLFYIIQLILIGIFNVDDASVQQKDLGFGDLTGQIKESWLEMAVIFLSLAILTPIKEELLFRGLIHRFFEQKFHFAVGLVISSLIFGLLHIGFPYSAIAMGVIFVLLYRLTRSLVPSIILHVVWNSLVSVILISSS